ncbi:hypothetical protein BpHYR1_044317 [Brachionus plicatilis]|uniref:Protein kinase domain-containing protein n=1 Tax=Brachionus plicatilis TaxID=10195 RepID=A0A3M7T6I0_BRAPC|nr:hypothetical protein BpHYR1_044317 [Brachionus plicatilis]
MSYVFLFFGKTSIHLSIILTIQFFFFKNINKVLGEGNFGKVCLAIVSDEAIAPEQSQDESADLSKTERIKKRLSIRRNNQSNYSVSSDPEVVKPLIDDSKLPKNSRKVAVKICKVQPYVYNLSLMKIKEYPKFVYSLEINENYA